MHEEYQQTCECGKTLSIVARYCSRCGDRVRELKDFETPIADGGQSPALRGENSGRRWGRKAGKNESKWGIQHPEELLSAITEEVGEIEQAYLEATHEDSDPTEVRREVDDLGPLLLQLVRSVDTHPLAFEPLPTAADVNEVSDDE